jgi:hypothetical protein
MMIMLNSDQVEEQYRHEPEHVTKKKKLNEDCNHSERDVLLVEVAAQVATAISAALAS